MRAREFIVEDAVVHTHLKPRKNHEYAMPGAHRFGGVTDRTYLLNRLMQCVAASDGHNTVDVPVESWIGLNNGAFPYTKEEADMLKHAYQAMGVEWEDVLAPNPKNQSQEIPERQTQSPIKPFKGYPR